jgi:hypothetical protein
MSLAGVSASPKDESVPVTRPPRSAIAAAVATVLLAGSCRSMPPPVEQFAVSRTAIEDAIDAGAAQFAAADLDSARSKLEQARRLSAGKNQAQARRLAEQAEVDARLAAAKARIAHAQRELANVEDGTPSLTAARPQR